MVELAVKALDQRGQLLDAADDVLARIERVAHARPLGRPRNKLHHSCPFFGLTACGSNADPAAITLSMSSGSSPWRGVAQHPSGGRGWRGGESSTPRATRGRRSR